jgi:hypothetical protein
MQQDLQSMEKDNQMHVQTHLGNSCMLRLEQMFVPAAVPISAAGTALALTPLLDDLSSTVCVALSPWLPAWTPLPPQSPPLPVSITETSIHEIGPIKI